MRFKSFLDCFQPAPKRSSSSCILIVPLPKTNFPHSPLLVISQTPHYSHNRLTRPNYTYSSPHALVPLHPFQCLIYPSLYIVLFKRERIGLTAAQLPNPSVYLLFRCYSGASRYLCSKATTIHTAGVVKARSDVECLNPGGEVG